jgi:hypothetical protein
VLQVVRYCIEENIYKSVSEIAYCKGYQSDCTAPQGTPAILLEAVVDYHMFFWHVFYGYTGNIGDLNVLNMSPLLERMRDGTFHELEEESGVVPFEIDGEQFNKCLECCNFFNSV